MAAVIESEVLRGKAAASHDKRERVNDMDIGAELQAIKAVLPHLATKADVSELRAEMHKSFGDLKWSMVIWFVGTGLASAALAFTVAKLIS